MSRTYWLATAMTPLLVLAGCTRPEQPGLELRTVTVREPVPVACVARHDIPAEPELVSARLTGDAKRDLDIVAASNLRVRQWGRALHGMLQACAKAP